MLAVVADRAGAMPFDREKSPLTPGFVFRHDRIGFLPAARNLAVDPAGRSEFDRTHHAAFEIVQTPQERDMPDRALDVVCPEGFQAGRSASSAKGSRGGGLQRSCADAPSCKTAASDPLGAAPGETARTNLFSNVGKGQVRSRHLSRPHDERGAACQSGQIAPPAGCVKRFARCPVSCARARGRATRGAAFPP